MRAWYICKNNCKDIFVFDSKLDPIKPLPGSRGATRMFDMSFS